MARTETLKQNDGLVRRRSGSILDDAASPAAAAIALGFKPMQITVVNVTDRIQFEWYDGMASNSSVQTVAAGTRTLEAASGPTVAADGVTIGFPVLQNKQYRWYAVG